MVVERIIVGPRSEELFQRIKADANCLGSLHNSIFLIALFMLSKSCELRNDRRNVMLHVTFCERDKLFQFSKAENVFHPFSTF